MDGYRHVPSKKGPSALSGRGEGSATNRVLWGSEPIVYGEPKQVAAARDGILTCNRRT
jgi:hypothetical protein